MSPWTKRLQRRTRSLAPFSGLRLIACACASGEKSAVPAPSIVTVAAPAELSRKRRRLKGWSVMSCLLGCGSGCDRISGGEALAAAGIEEVGALQVGLQMDRAAGRELVALAEDGSDVGRAVAAGDEGIGARRLED